MEMIKAQFSGESIFSNSSEAFSLYEKSRFGEKIEGRIEYLPVEALHLIRIEKMDIYFKDKTIGFDELIKKMKKFDKKIETKLTVFSDLRRKGYIVKSALKFGTDFRIYDKGAKPGEEHARWILYIARENDILKWHEFSAKNRIAHSTKKNLLLAVIDGEGDIIYYEVSWMKL